MEDRVADARQVGPIGILLGPWVERTLQLELGPGNGRPRLFEGKFLMNLVDLVRFELTTSSMPFKKYQSLAESLAQNKRLSKRRRGLQSALS